MWWDKPSDTPKPVKEMKPFPFMRYRWIGFVVTAAILIITCVSLATRGLNMGLDFTGGVLIEATQAEQFNVGLVREEVEKLGFGESQVTLTEGGRTALIRLPAEASGPDVDTITRKVTEALGQGVTIRKTDAVGPRVSDELFQGGVLAALLAILAIAVYIWFRFESKFGFAAFITTFHDVFAIAGLFSITQWTFDLTVVAAALTIAGYSINDTVVVFDRVREMLKKYKKLDISSIIDISITSTLSRTLITSVATQLAVLAMLLLGGPVLFGFAAAITFGIVLGTYSSIFVAAPLLLYLPGKIPGQRIKGEDEPADTKLAT